MGGIDTLLGKGVVKSVQRGVITRTNEGALTSIPISTIDPEKAVAVVTMNGKDYHFGYDVIATYSLEANQIAFSFARGTGSDSKVCISWQVIEFY